MFRPMAINVVKIALNINSSWVCDVGLTINLTYYEGPPDQLHQQQFTDYLVSNPSLYLPSTYRPS